VSSDLKLVTTVNAARVHDFNKMIPVVMADDSRDSTIFLVAEESESFSILGTFDQIIDFATAIMAEAYTWILTNNRGDWLTGEDQAMIREAAGDGSNTED